MNVRSESSAETHMSTMDAKNLEMSPSHSNVLEVKRCVTIGFYPSWVSNTIMVGLQTRKNYSKLWGELRSFPFSNLSNCANG